MSLTKVRSGQPLRISAEAFNAFIDAAQASQFSRQNREADGAGVALAAGVVLVRNDSGADQERFAVLGLGDPLIGPTANLAAFQERIALAAELPDAEEHAHRLVILQEPITAGAVGRGMIMGTSPVRLDVQAEDDALAALTTGTTQTLTTGATGGARILWKETGTGERWGLVQVPAGGVAGGSPNLVLAVSQPDHGWFVGDAMHWAGSDWAYADPASVGATDTIAVVGRIPDADTALLVLWGVLCLDGLQPHTDYWLDPTTPGAITATKPDTAPRLVLHHGEGGLCVLRSGSASSGGGVDRFADLLDVDVVSTPPADHQVPLWDAGAQRWVPGDVLRSGPVPANTVYAGPTTGTDAKPDFRHLILEDLPELQPCSVIANATASPLVPTAHAALDDDRALVRAGGTLQWLQISNALLADAAVTTETIAPGAVDTDALADHAVTSVKLVDGAVTTPAIADGAVTDGKVASLQWGKLTGVPTAFPPTPHDHPLGGVLTGTTSAAQLAPGVVGTTQLADGAVTPAKLVPIAGPAVLGQPNGGSALPSAIPATSDGGVLRRNGGLLDFARITDLEIANGAAISWSKISKAGAGAADVGAAPANHSHQLAGLGDVRITAPTVGQVLAYDAASGRWINDDGGGGGGGPGPMQPFSVWVNATSTNADGSDLPAGTNTVLARGLGNVQWRQVSRAMLDAGAAFSVLGRAGATDGPVDDIIATPDTVLRRNALGEFGFAKITALQIDSQQADSGFVLTSGFSGQAAWNRNVSLGSGPGTAASVQGSLVVVISTTGDYARISSAGIELFRRSVSVSVPMVKIDLNAITTWSPTKAMSIREVDICDNGVAKKMLVLASAPY